MQHQKSKIKNQNLPNITVASVGHIDHGKSSLFGRLLYDSGQVKPDRIVEWQKTGGNNFAFLLDSFEDEQKGEMTIDVFYSQFETKKYKFILIDDPGHLEFIKNMLTGISQATGVILVISAKPGEGIQFQTRRHMMLVKLLGIEQVLVVVNKMDLVGYDLRRFMQIKEEIGKFLRETGFNLNRIPFVPVSAVKGDNVFYQSKNMSWYREKTLYEFLDEVFSPPSSPIDKPLRIIFQGSFRAGDEEVVFSRVESGMLKKGQFITLSPENKIVKVQEMKSTLESKKRLLPTETGGLVLKGDIFLDKIGQQVGGSVKQPPRLVQRVLGEIFLLLDESIKRGDKLLFRVGTREISCLIEKILRRIDSETGEILEENSFRVEAAEMADVEISFDQPTVVEKFSDFPTLGRFLLFRGKKNIAAGITVN